MRRSIITVVLLLGAFLPATITRADPLVGGCQIFPSNNPWNLDVSDPIAYPVDALNSANYINAIGSSVHVHPDFGSDPTYGIPYTTVTGAQPKVPMIFGVNGYGDESDPGPYPFPSNTPIESGSDAHSIVIETGNCILYETFATHYIGGASHAWGADSGAIFNLDSNAQRTVGWTSADAAGMAIFPGLARCIEANTGTISHAFRFTAPTSSIRNTYVYPASHIAGSGGSNTPPMGQRFRLKASVMPNSFSQLITGQALAIFNALKKYGIILADGGTSWYISGETNRNNCWDDNSLNLLKQIPGSDFEALDPTKFAPPGEPLNPPKLYSPANAAQVSATPVLDWNTVTGAERYEVALDQNATPTTHAAYVDATDPTEFTPTIPLITGFTYYWQVRVVDSNDNPVTLWSTPRSFIMASSPGAAPIRNYVTTGTPTLTWNRVSSAVRYELEVAGNLAFSGATSYDPQNALFFKLTTALTDGTYYWRVRACTGAASSTCGSWIVGEPILVNS